MCFYVFLWVGVAGRVILTHGGTFFEELVQSRIRICVLEDLNSTLANYNYRYRCLCVCVCVCVCVCLFVCVCLCLFVSLSFCPYVWVSVCVSVCVLASVCFLYKCVSVLE